jgi:alanine racemase
MEMFRRTYADINLEHLVHNWYQIKKVAGDDRFICPMIKANAYGHGDVQVAQALSREGALGLGVCLIEEGLLLRAAGIKTDILVFRGFDNRGAEKILEYQLIPVVSTWEQIYSLEAAADEAVKVHLKFNTGMNRIGFNIDQAEKLDEYFSKSKKLKLKAILSHFAMGEDSHLPNGFSVAQMNEFLKILEFFKGRGVYSHLLNSGGIAGLAKARVLNSTDKNKLIESHNWGFRPGLMLYGYQPAPQFSEIDLKPVMSLKSVINNIRSIKVGDSVSYGCTWTAARPSRIAIIPIGYADGVHRLVSNRSHVLFLGKKVPIVGRVCMDFLMLDVTDVVMDSDPNQWVEEDVVLFGFDEKNNFLSAQEMAANTNTIVWETLTSVGERVPRHFKGLKKI